MTSPAPPRVSFAALKHLDFGAGSPPTSNHSQLRVMLHNVLLALEHGHVKEGSVIEVVTDWIGRVEDQLRSAGAVHVDRAQVLLNGALLKAQRSFLFSRSHQLKTFSGRRAVSFQPSWAFHWWLPDVTEPALRRPDPHLSDIAIIIETYGKIDVGTLMTAFETTFSPRSGKYVGPPGGVVFFAPEFEEIHDLCAEATRIYEVSGRANDDMLDDLEIADRFRNLLGLRSRNSSERAVIIRLKENIGIMQAAATSGAPSPRPIAAPTLFDAVGHTRFRHWPQVTHGPATDYGRTFDLDNTKNSHPNCGAAEFVVAPVPVTDIASIVPAGRIRAATETHDDMQRSDAHFAEALCGTRTVDQLIDALEARLFP